MSPAPAVRPRSAAGGSRNRATASTRTIAACCGSSIPTSMPISWAALSTRRPRTSSTTAGTIPLARRGPSMRESLFNPRLDSFMRTSGLRTRPLGLFSKGDAVMPTRITTRAARVALANRDYEQARAEIEAKIDARMQQLHADPRATDKAAFLSLCKADQELRVLAIQLGAANAERGVVLDDDVIVTLEDDGRVRWTLREYDRHLA